MSKKSREQKSTPSDDLGEEVSETTEPKKEKRPRKFSFGWLKGLIGLVVLLGVLIGAGYWVVNHENNARMEDANSAAPTASANAETKCYTVAENTVFASGYPAWDQLLRYALDHPENVQYQKFVKDYLANGRLDSSDPVYKEILGKVDKDQTTTPVLQMNPNNELAPFEPAKDAQYEQAVTEHPEGAYKSGMYVLKVNVYETVAGKKQTKEMTIIVGISQEKGENDIVFSIQKPDNGGTIDGFGVTQILPICK